MQYREVYSGHHLVVVCYLLFSTLFYSCGSHPNLGCIIKPITYVPKVRILHALQNNWNQYVWLHAHQFQLKFCWV